MTRHVQINLLSLRFVMATRSSRAKRSAKQAHKDLEQALLDVKKTLERIHLDASKAFERRADHLTTSALKHILHIEEGEEGLYALQKRISRLAKDMESGQNDRSMIANAVQEVLSEVSHQEEEHSRIKRDSMREQDTGSNMTQLLKAQIAELLKEFEYIEERLHEIDQQYCRIVDFGRPEVLTDILSKVSELGLRELVDEYEHEQTVAEIDSQSEEQLKDQLESALAEIEDEPSIDERAG